MTRQLAPLANDQIRHLSTDDLKTHLARALEMTTAAISYMASVVSELERRGEDLAHLRHGLMPYLRSVTSGRLAPETIVAFSGQKMLMRAMERLPRDRQVEIATSRSVMIDRDGEVIAIDTRDIRPSDIARIVRGSTEAPGTPPLRAPSRPRMVTVVATVSEAEHRALVARSVQAGMTISNLVREALGLPLAATSRGPRRRRHD